MIPILLGASILLSAAISTSFLTLQFANGGQCDGSFGCKASRSANPAGAPPGNATAANTTAANTTAGPAATPPANPAGAPPKVCSSPTMPKP